MATGCPTHSVKGMRFWLEPKQTPIADYLVTL